MANLDTTKTKMADFWADVKSKAPEIIMSVTTVTVGTVAGLWAWKHAKKYLK